MLSREIDNNIVDFGLIHYTIETKYVIEPHE